MQTTERGSEQLVVAKIDGGYRVFSALTPANQYVVRDTGDDVTCTCPEFSNHRDEPEWQCAHIAAVLTKFPPETAGNGAATQAASKSNGQAVRPKASGAQMLLKRSVSTDGKIDSLSFEFSCDVAKTSRDEIKGKAEQMLGIQSEIVDAFLKANAPRNGHSTPAADGPLQGTIVGTGGMPTRRGRRLFLDVAINGHVSKLFGTAKELGDALASAGIPNVNVVEGQQFNMACRVITKPSADGKYQNIDKLLPSAGGQS